MSHLSKVQVAIRDIDVLGEALRALGLRCVGEVAENYEFADTFNQCDVIAVNAVNRVMAFKFVNGEAELHSNLEPGDFERPAMSCCKNTLCCSSKKRWSRRENFRYRSRRPCPMAPSVLKWEGGYDLWQNKP